MSNRDKIIEALKYADHHAYSLEETADAILAKLAEGVEPWGWIDERGRAQELLPGQKYADVADILHGRTLLYTTPPDAQAQIDARASGNAVLVPADKLRDMQTERDALQAELAKRDARIEEMEKDAAILEFALSHDDYAVVRLGQMYDVGATGVGQDFDILSKQHLIAAIAQEQAK